MAFWQIVSLAVFLIIFISQLWRREWLASKVRYFLGFAVLVISVIASQMSWQQYSLWLGTEPSKFLLPPYVSIAYFLQYAMWKFWAPHIVSFLIGLIFFWLAKYYNKRRGDQFFYSDELYIIWLSIFLVGHPFWIFYLLIIFSVILIVSLIRSLIFKNNTKLPLYYFWLPIAAFVILISKWLSAFSFFYLLKI